MMDVYVMWHLFYDEADYEDRGNVVIDAVYSNEDAAKQHMLDFEESKRKKGWIVEIDDTEVYTQEKDGFAGRPNEDLFIKKITLRDKYEKEGA